MIYRSARDRADRPAKPDRLRVVVLSPAGAVSPIDAPPPPPPPPRLTRSALFKPGSRSDWVEAQPQAAPSAAPDPAAPSASLAPAAPTPDPAAPTPTPTPPAQDAANRLPAPPPLSADGRADLSPLEEVDDRLDGAPAPPRLPEQYTPQRRPELPYLSDIGPDPELHFVPDVPTVSLNPRAAWDDMMAPPPPTPAEVTALRLRNIGIGLLSGGGLLFLVAAPLMAQGDGGPARPIGYGVLSLTLGALGAGGAVVGVGERRLRAARRVATGQVMAPPVRLYPTATGLALTF